jgi:uncharacterized ubiquitin-like protein YukD
MLMPKSLMNLLEKAAQEVVAVAVIVVVMIKAVVAVVVQTLKVRITQTMKVVVVIKIMTEAQTIIINNDKSQVLIMRAAIQVPITICRR